MRFVLLCLAIILFVSSYKVKHDKVYLMNEFAKDLLDTRLMTVGSETVETYRFINDDNRNKTDILEGSVLMGNCDQDEKFTFVQGYLDNDINNKTLIARGRYTKSLHQIGWSRLHIETFDKAIPEILSWAAGYIEGRLTAPEMLDFYKNLVGIHTNEMSSLNTVFDYFKQVEQYIRNKTSKESLKALKSEELEYWITVALIQAQTDGLLEGYLSHKGELDILTLAHIYFINADGEVPELLTVFRERQGINNYSFKEGEGKFTKKYLKQHFGTDNPQTAWDKLMSDSHCTAVIKLIKDGNSIKDILIGHTTWDSYAEMHRIFKMYRFRYTLYGKSKEVQISLSSYPGTLTSTDDFYVLNKKIVILETTLEMLDRSVYNKINPGSHVPNYIRISVAHRLANDAQQWTEAFRQNNSGTYNSQWMIIDTSKLTFKSLFELQNIYTYNGLFYVLEQSPGLIEVQDMTRALLDKGYWGSFNRPYFSNISNNSGYAEMMTRYGRTYSYFDNPRAQLIDSTIQSINGIEEFKLLMRHNQSIGNNDYVNTISPRFDLNNGVRKASGGIDAKIVNLEMIKSDKVLAVSGPSTQNNVKPFDFTEWSTEPHYGLPKVWNFDWVVFSEENVKNDIKGN
jgi:hypothetical protein